MSELYELRGRDFLNSALSAVFVAVISSLYGAVSQVGFNVFNADWGVILGSALNIAFIAFVGVLTHAFVQDRNGKTFGSI